MDKIIKAIAYKIDLGTTDEIRIDVYYDNGTIETFSEEENNYKGLIETLDKIDGVDKDWFSKVSQPAFKRCETVIFENN